MRAVPERFMAPESRHTREQTHPRARGPARRTLHHPLFYRHIPLYSPLYGGV